MRVGDVDLGSPEAARQLALSITHPQCYIITMIDPLSPTAGVLPRLALAGLLLAGVWLAVLWAIV